MPIKWEHRTPTDRSLWVVATRRPSIRVYTTLWKRSPRNSSATFLPIARISESAGKRRQGPMNGRNTRRERVLWRRARRPELDHSNHTRSTSLFLELDSQGRVLKRVRSRRRKRVMLLRGISVIKWWELGRTYRVLLISLTLIQQHWELRVSPKRASWEPLTRRRRQLLLLP